MINNNSNLYGVSCVALRDLIVFPNMVLNFDAGRKKSIEAVRSAMAGDRGIFLVTQYETAVEDPKQNDVYTVGCYAKIRHILKISENEIRVLVGGVKRAKLNLLYSEGAHLKADITLFEDEPIKRSENYVEALFRKVKENFEKYALVNGRIPPDIIMEVMSANSLSYLCDYIAMQIPASMDDKHVLLEEANVINRAKALTLLLKKEGQIIAFDKKIDAEVRTAMDDQHREYYMREQIKALNNELYGDDSGDEIEDYRSRILSLNAPEEIKEKLLLDNVVEINSYSTYKDNVLYAGVDKDSRPGNAIPGNRDTYEDDTDAAPALALELADARKITGTVFLDSTTEELKVGVKE